jgi:predicted ATPase
VVLTGGPGAGKTAVLEVIRRNFGDQVEVLPEAASILFKGGFPRNGDSVHRRAAQRAIFHVQRELERMAQEEGAHAVALCDRGTLDGLAYWPEDPATFWSDLATTSGPELARYHAVIHLRTPPARHYNHKNPIRIESPAEAAVIDERILQVWSAHPRRYIVDSTVDFLDKLVRVLSIINAQLTGEGQAFAMRGVEGPNS